LSIIRQDSDNHQNRDVGQTAKHHQHLEGHHQHLEGQVERSRQKRRARITPKPGQRPAIPIQYVELPSETAGTGRCFYPRANLSRDEVVEHVALIDQQDKGQIAQKYPRMF
jgi:hypothetical protein